jgi:hypothetical protein
VHLKFEAFAAHAFGGIDGEDQLEVDGFRPGRQDEQQEEQDPDPDHSVAIGIVQTAGIREIQATHGTGMARDVTDPDNFESDSRTRPDCSSKAQSRNRSMLKSVNINFIMRVPRTLVLELLLANAVAFRIGSLATKLCKSLLLLRNMRLPKVRADQLGILACSGPFSVVHGACIASLADCTPQYVPLCLYPVRIVEQSRCGENRSSGRSFGDSRQRRPS